MTITRVAVWAAGAMVLVGAIAGGCGGAGQADSSAPTPSRAYTDVVTGLKKAALSNEPYHLARHTKELVEPERAVVDGFCEFAWQIPVNHQIQLLRQRRYVVGRITHLAEIEYRGVRVGYQIEDPSIEASIAELRRIVDLRSLNGRLIRKYSRACYPHL